MKQATPLMMLICLLLLFAACSQTDTPTATDKRTSTEIIEQSMKAHQDVDVLEVSLEEENEAHKHHLKMFVDFDGKEGNLYTEDTEALLYVSNEGVIQTSKEQAPTEVSSPSLDTFLEQMEQHRNPLGFLVLLHEKIADNMTVAQTNDIYTLSFDGSNQLAQQIGETFLQFEEKKVGREATTEMDQITIDTLHFSVDIDKDTYLVKDMNQIIEYALEGDKEKQTSRLHYEYSKYNEPEHIKRLSLDDEAFDKNSVTDEEKEIASAAADYVDALIEATIFQDEAAFIKKAPATMSADKKETEAKIQKEYFRDRYIENTKQAMQGFNIETDEIEKLTDAFLHAVSQTSYEIGESNMIAEEELVVTVSVKGFDERKVYEETEKAVQKAVKNEKLNQQEAISENIAILREYYQQVDTLEPPVDVNVHVTVDDGEFIVLDTDEFVAGFVRQ